MFDGGNKTEPTDVYVVGLKDGKVHGPYEAPYAYSGHHINAYEKSEEKIVIDFCPTPWENFREYLKLENMLNPPAAVNWESDISTTNGEVATRFTIDTYLFLHLYISIQIKYLKWKKMKKKNKQTK